MGVAPKGQAWPDANCLLPPSLVRVLSFRQHCSEWAPLPFFYKPDDSQRFGCTWESGPHNNDLPSRLPSKDRTPLGAGGRKGWRSPERLRAGLHAPAICVQLSGLTQGEQWGTRLQKEVALNPPGSSLHFSSWPEAIYPANKLRAMATRSLRPRSSDLSKKNHFHWKAKSG